MSYEITIGDSDVAFEVTFVPDVGMVGASLRHEGEELLFKGEGLGAYAQSHTQFALPLLHPWANRIGAWEFDLDGRPVRLDPDAGVAHRDAGTGTAIHGLLTASPHWVVADADRDRLTAELDFAAVPEYMAAFPFPHRVRYAVNVEGSTLWIALTVIASGEVAVPVSFGFHPYLTLPGSDRREWQLEIPVAKQAVYDERMLPTGETIDLAPGELDGPLGERAFDTNFPVLYSDGVAGGEGPVAFVLADQRRRVTLTHVSGYPVSQVYSPQGAQFVCYEPMTAPVNALITGERLHWVAPGERFEAVFTISAERV